MRISFVELSGFRGFKEPTRFEFPAGFVVLTGRNGAGKSTVLDAIDYALTGTIDKYVVKSAKGGGLDSHIWWVGEGAPALQYVTVGFVGEDGREFPVTRSRESGLRPTIEEIGQTFCTTDPVGDWTRTLVQTTLIRDETLASLSLDLPERERFEAVRAAIGGLTGVDHSQRTGELVTVAKSLKIQQEGKLQEVQHELGRALSLLTEARSLADRQPDVAEAERTLKRLTPDLDIASPELSELLRRRVAERKQSLQSLSDAIERAERIGQELAFLASPDVAAQKAALSGQIEMLALTHERQGTDMRAADAAYAAEKEADTFAVHMVGLLNHGEAIGLVEGHCPLCDAVRTDAEFAAALVAARSRLSERGKRVSAAQSRLESARQAYAETERSLEIARATVLELTSRQDRALAEVAQINSVFKRYQIDVEATDPSRARQLALKRQEETAEIEHALFILEASSAHDRVSTLEGRIEQLRAAVDAETLRVTEAEKAFESAKQIDNAAKTVANQVLTEQFDTVMPLLKELYQRLRPHTDWREIETDFGGKIRASLNFTVGEGMNPQFLFSSGQRRAAGLAFLLAIHLSRPWAKLKCLLLDDPIQHIDDYRALNLVEVLSAIRRMGRQVVVAVEDPALADLLCRRLRSSVEETGRRFDLSMNRNGSASIAESKDILPLPKKVLELADAS